MNLRRARARQPIFVTWRYNAVIPLSFEQSEMRQVREFASRGHPKNDEDPRYHYKIEANPFTDLDKVNSRSLKLQHVYPCDQ